MRWRLLPLAARSGALNMAVDEAVAEAVRDGGPPTVRFYRWSPGAVSLGAFQSADEEVDREACARRGVDIVRRRTGGGAVYHDPAGEVTYSVIAPEALFGRDITASYREVCGWIVDALAELGIAAEHRPVNDVVVGGRKVSGSAQTRREGVFLMHGTVLRSLDREAMFSLLTPSPLKRSGRPAGPAGEGVTCIAEHAEVSPDGVVAALRRAFLRDREWEEGDLTAGEEARAWELVALRYANDGWTFSR